MPNKEVYTDTHFDGNLIMDEQSVKELVEKCINGKSIMSKKFTNDDRYIQNISQTIYLYVYRAYKSFSLNKSIKSF